MSVTDAPDLDDQLCVAVYRAAHAFTATYRTLLQPYDLTYPQYVVLLALWQTGRAGDPPPTVRELGAVTDLDSGTLSPLLGRLEQAGLVHRVRGDRDARTVHVLLTDQGRHLESEIADVPHRLAACTGLDRTTTDALLSGLHELTHQLRQASA